MEGNGDLITLDQLYAECRDGTLAPRQELDLVMARNRMSARELASLLGVSPAFVSQVLGGSKKPPKEFVGKVRQILRVDLSGELAATPAQRKPAQRRR